MKYSCHDENKTMNPAGIHARRRIYVHAFNSSWNVDKGFEKGERYSQDFPKWRVSSRPRH